MAGLSINAAIAHLGGSTALLPSAAAKTAAFMLLENTKLESNETKEISATASTPLIDGKTAQALAEVNKPTAAEKFLEEIKKTPMERLREQILKSLGYTEESLDAMAPEDRKAVEEKIAKIIEEKMRQGMRENGYDVSGGAKQTATSAAIEFIA